jgi:hypothetical protein
MESNIIKDIQIAIPGTPRVVALAAVLHVTNEQVYKKTGEDRCIIRKPSSESTELITGDQQLSCIAGKMVLSFSDFLRVAQARIRQQVLMASANPNPNAITV